MIITCLRCRHDKPIQARGLCPSCYGHVYRQGELDRYPANAPKGRPSKPRLVRRHLDWHQIADDRRREIARLRAEVAALRAQVEAT